MKKYNHPVIMLALIFAASLVAIVSCNKVAFDNEEEITAEEIHSKLLDNNITSLDVTEVKRLLDEEANSPCTFDYNFDGYVNIEDLSTFLANFGEGDFTVTTLGHFLANFGTVYTVDIIPHWSNDIQDVNCNVNTFDPTHRVKCEGVLNYPPVVAAVLEQVDSTKWFYDGVEVSSMDTLTFKTYGGVACDGQNGFQPPCTGLVLLTCRVTVNGSVYERTNMGYARINIDDSLDLNILQCPGSVSSDYELMDFLPENYTDLEFLIN